VRTRELPPPLPPETRTVGQLVAETIRAYGERFWRVLPLGLPLAVLDEVAAGRSATVRLAAFAAASPLLAAAYALASAAVADRRVEPRALLRATLTGTAVLLPATLLFTWFALLAIAYLAFVGLVVPVSVIEGRRPLAAFRRAGELARADYVHAVGSLAALAIVFFLSRLVLVSLLHGQADNTIRVAVFIADLVLAPLLLLGGALLLFDQAARVGSRPTHRRSRTRRRDAALHPPLDADPAGRPDAEVES
jgi:hypothetical protein